MNKLISATIDVGVLALPKDQGSAQSVYRYVNSLLDWSALLEERWIGVTLSELSIEALISHDRYPLLGHLRELLESCHIREFDANTIMRIATRLLEITPCFEDKFGIRNVLLDQASLDPDPGPEGTERCLHPELVRCAALVAIARSSLAHLDERDFSLVVRMAPKEMISFRALVHDIEHSLDEPPGLARPPAFYQAELPVCDNFSGLIAKFDEAGLLLRATDDIGIELAARIALFKYDRERDGESQWTSRAVVRIGGHFRQSCQRCCIDKGPAMPQKILRVIVEMIRKQKLHTAHALRTDVKGSSPQKLRGSDKAWRRDIDRKIHLHYWECPHGVFELASVTFHDDFTIPE